MSEVREDKEESKPTVGACDDEEGAAPQAEVDCDSAETAAINAPVDEGEQAREFSETVQVTEPPEAPGRPAEVAGLAAADLVETLGGLIHASTERVLAVFADKLAYDAAKQLQIDRLHEELQSYRSDQVARASRPLLLGIIGLHDDLSRVIESLEAQATEPEGTVKLLAGFQHDIELLLGHHGVSVFRSSDDTFDPRRQRIIKKVPTDEQHLIQKVTSLRVGFEKGQEILEKERVGVFVPVAGAQDPRDTIATGGETR